MFGSEEQIFSYIREIGRGIMEEEEAEIITEEVMGKLPERVENEQELNEIICNMLTSMCHRKKNYDTLAVRLLQNMHNSKTPFLYSDVVKKIQKNQDVLGNFKPLLSPEFVQFVERNRAVVDRLFQEVVESSEHFAMTVFGWRTLQRHYLIQTHEGIMERPDHLWFRISLFLHRSDWDAVRESFLNLRRGCFIHATPTLFHAGLKHSQMASCFLVGTEDSVTGIFKTIGDAAQISKWAGGIGIHISNIRGKNSYIHGTNGVSNGIMPMLKVYNDTSRYIDQGGGKRNGAFAMYIEPWHSDIFDFVSARRNIGSEEERARDLFYALWIPDLFMKQVQLENGDWYLISPSQAPELPTLCGSKFEEAYWRHVSNGNYHKKIKARQLWVEILRSQIETGTPYMLYKDTCNRRSNQQHLGTIRSSNLCCEIIEYSDDKEYAVCNLGSIALPKFLLPPTKKWDRLQIYTKPGCSYCILLKHFLTKHGFVYEEDYDIPAQYQSSHRTYPLVLMDGNYVGGFQECWERYLCPSFDYETFGQSIRILVRNLNGVIDRNAYPLPECRRSNMRHRPVGIGVQGLADVFFAMRIPYDSSRARALNAHIFEAIYYYALRASMQLAEEQGTYESYEGSPMSRGLFHFEMGGTPLFSGMFDWEQLRGDIRHHGIRNSLLVAPMPTASTSQILGNTESFEPLTNNLYVRRTLAGEFYVCNAFLREDLEVLGYWNNQTMDHLIIKKGSVQELPISATLKDLYRTVWEIPQKSLIDMAADRQMFIDQSQSFNIYLNEPNMDKLTKIHFYGWKKGLKTGSYYVRSRAAISSQNVTVDPLKEECTSCSA